MTLKISTPSKCAAPANKTMSKNSSKTASNNHTVKTNMTSPTAGATTAMTTMETKNGADTTIPKISLPSETVAYAKTC